MIPDRIFMVEIGNVNTVNTVNPVNTEHCVKLWFTYTVVDVTVTNTINSVQLGKQGELFSPEIRDILLLSFWLSLQNGKDFLSNLGCGLWVVGCICQPTADVKIGLELTF